MTTDAKPVFFTTFEATAALRYVRAVREGIHADAVLLAEKLRTHGNGPAREAIRLLEEEILVFDTVIHKIWASLL